MTKDIIRKLTAELDSGITTEVQVVYVLAGIRKIIERDDLRGQYPSLNFHCDWALHAHLDRAGAKAILKHFDAAQPLFNGNLDIYDFPSDLRQEIDRISQMKLFRKELITFLNAYDLPPITRRRSDGWTHFLHFYTQVIEDIPLVVADPSTTQHISKIVVQCELARETVKHEGYEEMLFKVSWNIYDKQGNCGEFS